MERTLTNITDTAQVKQLLALELSRQLDNGVQEVVPGFYRNHKKIWAYQSGEEFFKVTSHSRPALSGEGKDFVLRFFKSTARRWQHCALLANGRIRRRCVKASELPDAVEKKGS